ncbi:MAG: shikimate kinase [Pseudomonadales bacterium]
MSVPGIVLTGMPGAGKSTVGVLLAKELGWAFVDTDLLIQVRAGKTLQKILDESDYMHLRHLEEQELLQLDAWHKVVATGGSAVYSEAGMAHIAEHATVIYLDVPLDRLRARISNYDSRGIARRPEQSFAELFEERTALYRRYANHSVSVADCTAEDVLQKVLKLL